MQGSGVIELKSLRHDQEDALFSVWKALSGCRGTCWCQWNSFHHSFVVLVEKLVAAGKVSNTRKVWKGMTCVHLCIGQTESWLASTWDWLFCNSFMRTRVSKNCCSTASLVMKEKASVITGTPANIDGDKQRLWQLQTNLSSNACTRMRAMF